jgi:hypothetical protein
MMDYGYERMREKLQTETGKRFYARVKKSYEERFEGKPIPVLDYRKYKLIYQTGNRTEFEEGFFVLFQREKV